MNGHRIAPSETEIRGRWVVIDDQVEGDSACRRIDWLVSHHLKELGHDASGWDQLFVDPDDGRFWELTYPEGEQHGGGPPCLRYLEASRARARYPGLEA